LSFDVLALAFGNGGEDDDPGQRSHHDFVGVEAAIRGGTGTRAAMRS
jgi:hypothetical protein